MARAVPLEGQVVSVGGMAMVVVATVGVMNRCVGEMMRGVGVVLLVVGGVFRLQAVSRSMSQQPMRENI
jgi:hypothetical protein